MYQSCVMFERGDHGIASLLTDYQPINTILVCIHWFGKLDEGEKNTLFCGRGHSEPALGNRNVSQQEICHIQCHLKSLVHKVRMKTYHRKTPKYSYNI